MPRREVLLSIVDRSLSTLLGAHSPLEVHAALHASADHLRRLSVPLQIEQEVSLEALQHDHVESTAVHGPVHPGSLRPSLGLVSRRPVVVGRDEHQRFRRTVDYRLRTQSDR